MRNPTLKPAHLRARQGFTLLELVVVVAVLVILAGFILPKFDVFKLKANKGVAAANMSGISRLIQQYYVQNAVYPDRWDSLLNADGTALWAPGAPGGTSGLDPQLVGGVTAEGVTGDGATPAKLTVSDDLEAGEVRSLTRIGIANVLDLDATGNPPNDRFATTRAIAVGGKVATINVADGDGQNIVKHIYPGTDGTAFPTGKKLVVFGLGSRNSMVGKVMQEVPFYSNTDVTQYYSRYLAVFEVSSGGSRAELKAVIGSDGDLIKEEIADYYER